MSKTIENIISAIRGEKLNESELGGVFARLSKKERKMEAFDLETARLMVKTYGVEYYACQVIELMTHAKLDPQSVTADLEAAALLCCLTLKWLEENNNEY